jgi:hypothetical protein
MRTIKIKDLPYDFVVFNTIGDGSCLIHSILYCFNKTYRKENILGRKKIAYELRKSLADVLEEKREDGKTYYEILSRGEIKELSNFHPKLKLNLMQHHLKSHNWIDIFFVELISDQLEIDILFYDENKKEFYQTGDLEIYHKNRNTILINYQDDYHFEAMGINLDKIRTFFDPNCHIIKEIKEKFYLKGN